MRGNGVFRTLWSDSPVTRHSVTSSTRSRPALKPAERNTQHMTADDRDYEEQTEWGDYPPEDIDEDELEAEVDELEAELEDEFDGCDDETDG